MATYRQIDDIHSGATYWLLIPIQDVFFGKEPHAVHQTHLTIALLSTNTDAVTNRLHTNTWTHTHYTQNKAGEEINS